MSFSQIFALYNLVNLVKKFYMIIILKWLFLFDYNYKNWSNAGKVNEFNRCGKQTEVSLKN